MDRAMLVKLWAEPFQKRIDELEAQNARLRELLRELKPYVDHKRFGEGAQCNMNNPMLRAKQRIICTCGLRKLADRVERALAEDGE